MRTVAALKAEPFAKVFANLTIWFRNQIAEHARSHSGRYRYVVKLRGLRFASACSSASSSQALSSRTAQMLTEGLTPSL
jgi:hypothetical protein